MRRPPIVLLLLTATLLAACGPGGEPSAEQTADDVQADLPNGWSTQVVDDARVGSYVLTAPDPAAIWVVGDPTDELSAATGGSSWAGFWLPALDAATDGSNVRAVVADTATVSGDVVSFHVNVNPHDPGLELDDAAQLADQLQDRFVAQGLEVSRSGTTRWRDRTIAEVAFRVPAEVFDGEVRYVRQWFIAQDEPPVMWSFTCDAPDGPEASADACRQALDGFVPSTGGEVDAA